MPKLLLSVINMQGVQKIDTDCKTMEPQKLGGNRKMVVCEHVDRFIRLPIGPHRLKKVKLA